MGGVHLHVLDSAYVLKMYALVHIFIFILTKSFTYHTYQFGLWGSRVM